MTNLLLVVFVLMITCLITKYVVKVKKNRTERKQEANEWDLELANYRAQRQQEKIDWNQRVQTVKRHLVGKDWRDPAGKEEFVKELFGDEVPDYLWYEFKHLNEEEVQQVCDFFWDGRPSFGDLEPHRNLRIRNAKRFTAMLLDKYPLDQIGYDNFWETPEGDGFPTGVVLFSSKGFYENKPEPVTV